MRHPHFFPPHLAELEIEPERNTPAIQRLLDDMDKRRKSKRVDDAGEFWLSKPADLEPMVDPRDTDPCEPVGWGLTIALALAAVASVVLVCMLGGIAWQLYGYSLTQFVKAAPWPRLG